MSLLLQALKKSEDERAQRRNGLPLHAGRTANAGSGARSNAPLWAALVFGGIAAGLTAWVFMGGKAAGPNVGSIGTTAPTPATISSAPAAPVASIAIAPPTELAAAPIPAPMPVPAPALPQATPAPETQSPAIAEAPKPTRSLFIDPPTAAPATKSATPVTPVAPSAAPVVPPTAVVAKVTPPMAIKPTTASPTRRDTPTPLPSVAIINADKSNDPAVSIKKTAPSAEVINFNDLPPELRTELPALRPTGYMHADDANERLIAINDRLVRVGDEVVPGLRVQALTPTAVVFSYKGYRFRVTQ